MLSEAYELISKYTALVGSSLIYYGSHKCCLLLPAVSYSYSDMK